MKISYLKIVIVLLCIVLISPATRADEISELVAAIANTMKNIKEDRRVITFDSLPRYESKDKTIDLDVLDGIYNAMTFEASLNYVLDAYDYSASNFTPRDPQADYWRSRPTLARSDFFRPVPGMITSRFGWRAQFNRMHHGVDLRLNIGDTVRAAVSGIVTKIAYDHDGYGNYVVMTHPDGMETIYGHLSYSLVSQGQYVEMGRPVAIGGNTGNSTGPHLHFEARMGGVAIDPTLIFDFYGNYRSFASVYHTDRKKSSDYDPAAARKSTYVVRYGDTVAKIARKTGLSVSRLRQLNMIGESEPLKVGRMLKLK